MDFADCGGGCVFWSLLRLGPDSVLRVGRCVQRFLPLLFHIFTRNSPSVLLTLPVPPSEDCLGWPPIRIFWGARSPCNTARAIFLWPASGTFVADSGRSIFLEQHIEQRGKRSYFRWEIPYGYIHRIEEVSEPQPDAAAEPAPSFPIVWPRRLALHKRPRRRLRSCDCRDGPKTA